MTALTNTDEKYSTPQQDLLLVRIGTAGGNMRPDGRKFRTTIRRNAYDFQSRAKVELWSPPNGWVEVVSLDGTHPVMAELPSYVTRDAEAATKALRSVALMLETQAEEITR